jgi:seryl-tRNA synthetase
MALGEALGIIDVERASKVSGARFAYLKGDAVLLELALVQYALATLAKDGFVPVLPPHVVSTKAMAAMGYLDHGGEEEVYHLKNDDAVLIGTSEQAIGPMLMGETLDGAKLPLRFVGFSPCYRREAGSYGKDTKGILRMHQFDKVEMFSFTRPEDSDAEHALLLSLEEKLMQGLGIPHRVMQLCSADIGAPSARTYDIEAWMPSQGRYRETHSTSNTTDFQTRRLDIRYKDGKSKGLAHALNGTAFAIGRTLIAVLENFQRADGSVAVPEVLRPWMGGKEVIHA